MTSIAGPRPGLLPMVLRVDGWSTGLFGIAMAATAGIVFLLTGAALVATFAALEYVALRRADQ
ncbi:hypothetical protein ACWZHB_03735 [Nocardia sp. FBN12]|uniref:hypothetical protein n=1 Tax=Nocardia sp. FBN12 TaxID=3419766 RepID=UPI003CFBFE1C